MFELVGFWILNLVFMGMWGHAEYVVWVQTYFWLYMYKLIYIYINVFDYAANPFVAGCSCCFCVLLKFCAFFRILVENGFNLLNTITLTYEIC